MTAAAQWLRLVGCAGASAEVAWQPGQGKVKAQLQGNLQGKVVLCEGKFNARYAVPSMKGWMMNFADEDLGAVRFVVELELYGFVGAKGALTGAAGLSIDTNGKPKAVPQLRNRADSVADKLDPKSGLPRFVPAGLNETPPKDINGVQLKARAGAPNDAVLHAPRWALIDSTAAWSPSRQNRLCPRAWAKFPRASLWCWKRRRTP